MRKMPPHKLAQTKRKQTTTQIIKEARLSHALLQEHESA
jgi:hypothetical protein